eukprot:scaffold1800_cov87-Cyclotella_meneghiniana.AAC.9
MGVQEYLVSHNIERSDVGPFLFIHTILSAILVGSTWGICYFAGKHPVPQSFMKSSSQEVPKSVLLRSISKMPMLSDGSKRKICQAMISLESASQQSRAVQYIEQKIPSIDATLLCVSYAEAKFGRLFFKPITVPGRIWLSLKGAKLLKEYKGNQTKSIMKQKSMHSTFIGAKTDAIFRREFNSATPSTG